ncbi:MAG: glycosyltransferase family 4 protein [archaeon]
MKILMLNYEFPPIGGGAGNANYYLLKEFARYKNLEIELVTSSEGKTKTIEFSKNITVTKLNVGKRDHHHWTAGEIFRWAIVTYKFSFKKKYDLCHAWFGWPSGIIPYMQKRPYIVSLRGSDVPGFNPRLKFLDGTILPIISVSIWNRALAVVANSDRLRHLANKTWNGDIGVIPNGVDISEFKYDKSKVPGKKINIISVGRLIPRKRYNLLIKAVANMPEFSLTLVGDGELTRELKSLSKSLRADVTFLGKLLHEDVSKELRKADIFVLPSETEGMSNAMLEAMASGLPVIAGLVGGSDELIDKNGVILKQGSVSELTNAIIQYKDRDLLKNHGQTSRKIAEKFSWRNSAKSYHKLYSKCIK